MQVEYTLRDFSNYLSRNLGIEDLQTDDDLEGFDIDSNYGRLSISKGSLPGNIVIDMKICDINGSLSKEQLLQLVSSNFLSCSGIYIKDNTLGIQATSSPDSTLEQMYALFNVTINMAQFWKEKIC